MTKDQAQSSLTAVVQRFIGELAALFLAYPIGV
jgi:hypothetical protein